MSVLTNRCDLYMSRNLFRENGLSEQNPPFSGHHVENPTEKDNANNRKTSQDSDSVSEATNTNLMEGFQTAQLSSLPWQLFDLGAIRMVPKIPKLCNMSKRNAPCIAFKICNIAMEFVT